MRRLLILSLAGLALVVGVLPVHAQDAPTLVYVIIGRDVRYSNGVVFTRADHAADIEVAALTLDYVVNVDVTLNWDGAPYTDGGYNLFGHQVIVYLEPGTDPNNAADAIDLILGSLYPDRYEHMTVKPTN